MMMNDLYAMEMHSRIVMDEFQAQARAAHLARLATEGRGFRQSLADALYALARRLEGPRVAPGLAAAR